MHTDLGVDFLFCSKHLISQNPVVSMLSLAVSGHGSLSPCRAPADADFPFAEAHLRFSGSKSAKLPKGHLHDFGFRLLWAFMRFTFFHATRRLKGAIRGRYVTWDARLVFGGPLLVFVAAHRPYMVFRGGHGILYASCSLCAVFSRNLKKIVSTLGPCKLGTCVCFRFLSRKVSHCTNHVARAFCVVVMGIIYIYIYM